MHEHLDLLRREFEVGQGTFLFGLRGDRPEPEQYYSDCIQRIGDLADWFFHGFHAYAEPHHWSDQ